MRISHCGHSAVLVETDSSRVLIDPGNLSDGWHGLTDLDAILVTHLHPDHLDPTHLPQLRAANPSTKVYVETSIPALLASGDTDLGPLEPVASGDEIRLGDLVVSAVGGVHAEIHRDIPRIGNVGFVLRAEGEPSLFHPGDSYDTAPAGVDILAVPAYGPWAAMKETIDFVRAVAALEGFAIHDELLNERGRGLISGRVDAMTGTRLVDLRSGAAHEF
jgi:L-ascorbate metabolism protein UlaG (beta-lactamase superfamily)